MAKSIARYLADVASPSGVVDGTLSTAAQTNVTSLGTLSALTVDNLGINGNTITANSGALNLTPASGSAIVLDGTINVDAGVVTGATSITSTAFVGGLTGNVTGNVSGTAATVTGAAQTNITSLGTLTALTVDDITIDGSTISDAADLTLDVAGDIILDADGGDIRLHDAGVLFGKFTQYQNDLYIDSTVADKDIIFRGNDGGSTVTALTLDMSEAGLATFNSALVTNSTITAGSTIHRGNMTIDSQEIDVGSGDLTLDVAGDITLDADGGDIRLSDGGTQFGKFTRDGGDFLISSSENDKDMKFAGADGGANITALTLDMSEAGKATFNAAVTVGGNLSIAPASNTPYISGGTVSTVFRNNANSASLITILDGGNVLIGKTTTAFGTVGVRIDPTNIQVTTAGTTGYFNRLSSDGPLLDFYKDGTSVGTMFTNGGGIILKGASTSAPVQLQTHDGNEDIEVDPDGFIKMETAGAQRFRIDSSGRVLIGGQSSHASGYSTPGGNSGENAHYSKFEVQGNTYSTSGDGRITLSSGTAWPAANVALGQIFFSTAWGGDHASISCFSGGQVGNTDYPGDLRFSTTTDGQSSPVERMRIRDNGAVVIGGGNSFAQQGGGLLTLEGPDANMLVLHRTADTGDQEIRFYDHGDFNGAIAGKTGGGVELRSNGNSNVMFRAKPNVFSFGGGTTSHGRIRQYHFAIAMSANTTVALLQNNSGAHTDVNFIYWIEAYHSGRTYRTGHGTFGGYGLLKSSAGQGLDLTITAVSSGIKRLDFAASSLATTAYIGMLIFGDTALTVHNGTLGDMI